MPPPSRLGFWMVVSLVIGNMIGSGVFLLPASLAAFKGLGIAAWLVTAGGAACLALVFAHLARSNPAAGGLYAYTRGAFGDLPAFLVAWGYWISSWTATAALAIAGVGYLDPFIPSIVRAPAAAGALAIGMVWLFTLVNSIGIRAAGRVQVATTALKVLPLALIGIGGLFFFDAGAFEVPTTGPREAAAGLSAAATLTLWAFLGLESATIPAGSIENPARTIPRATVIGTLIAGGIYIVSTVGVMSLVPAEALATTTAPFADAARTLAGDTAARLVAAGAAVSCFGALNGWVLIVGQLPMAVARDGLFPSIFRAPRRRARPCRA
jgi:basic amino acid/polyamine antiporter, APA family